jgi:hypothetical protein
VLAVVVTGVFDLRHRVTTILKVIGGSPALVMIVATLLYGGNSVHGWFLLLPSAPGGPVQAKVAPDALTDS